MDTHWSITSSSCFLVSQKRWNVGWDVEESDRNYWKPWKRALQQENKGVLSVPFNKNIQQWFQWLQCVSISTGRKHWAVRAALSSHAERNNGRWLLEVKARQIQAKLKPHIFKRVGCTSKGSDGFSQLLMALDLDWTSFWKISLSQTKIAGLTGLN